MKRTDLTIDKMTEMTVGRQTSRQASASTAVLQSRHRLTTDPYYNACLKEKLSGVIKHVQFTKPQYSD